MPNMYTTIEHDGTAEFEEKKSLFIGHAKRVTTEDEAFEFIKEKKKEYFDARHNVYGFLLSGGQTARYSDDGEPQGSAGIPVLDVIRKSEVEDVCIVVTRYFGGILLGTGGLVRAYSHTAKLALDAANIVTYEKYTEMSLVCSYSDYQKLISVLEGFGAVIDGTDFSDEVRLRYAVKEVLCDASTKKICEITAGRIVPIQTGGRFDFHA